MFKEIPRGVFGHFVITRTWNRKRTTHNETVVLPKVFGYFGGKPRQSKRSLGHVKVQVDTKREQRGKEVVFWKTIRQDIKGVRELVLVNKGKKGIVGTNSSIDKGEYACVLTQQRGHNKI